MWDGGAGGERRKGLTLQVTVGPCRGSSPVHLHLDHPQPTPLPSCRSGGERLSQSSFPGREVLKWAVSRGLLSGSALVAHGKQDGAEGEWGPECSCNKGLGSSPAGLVLERGLGLYMYSLRPQPQPTMSHGIWAVPGQGGSLQLRAILERDEAVNRLLPTRPGAERTSLRW